LISAELDRELASVSARQANALTRASIVFAAAGVSAFALVSPLLGWSLVSTFLSVLSAFLCLAAIRYWSSRGVNMKRGQVGDYLKASPYDLLWRQVSDKFDELYAARSDLEKKANYIDGAVGMLVLAWLSAVAVRFLIEPILSGAI
jgi:hypothetical protein